MIKWHGIARALTTVFLLAVAYFFTVTLLEHIQATKGAGLKPNLYTVISVACFALAVIASALLWRSILNHSAKSVVLSRLDSIEIYIAAWLLKYLPGKAWSYAYRITVARRRGINFSTLINSFALESLFLLLASTIPAIPIVLGVALANPDVNLQILTPLLLLLPLLAFLHQPTTVKLTDILYRLLRQPKPIQAGPVPKRFMIGMQAAYLGPRILNGVAFIMIAQSLYGVTVDMWVPLVAFYMLAGILGSLAFFAPSGIGVREGVLVALSMHYFSLEEAATLAVVARIYTLFADLALAGVVLALSARNWSRPCSTP